MLTINGDENGQYAMTERINGNTFTTIVDSGSQVTIFEVDEVNDIIKRKTLIIRELSRDEE